MGLADCWRVAIEISRACLRHIGFDDAQTVLLDPQCGAVVIGMACWGVLWFRTFLPAEMAAFYVKAGAVS